MRTRVQMPSSDHVLIPKWLIPGVVTIGMGLIAHVIQVQIKLSQVDTNTAQIVELRAEIKGLSKLGTSVARIEERLDSIITITNEVKTRVLAIEENQRRRRNR